MSQVALLEPVVRTDVYDGPLELLLYLVQRDGIDVRNLPIAHITREYLACLATLQEMDLDVAGEFIIMAATLCELKSRELLPGRNRGADPTDEEDPREALARRIIEYQRYKEASEGLEHRLWLGRDIFCREPILVAQGERPIDPGVDSFGLLEVFQALLKRRKTAPPVHEVTRDPLRWVDCVRWVLTALDDQQEHTLDELFSMAPDRPFRVFTFLAVLELCRLHMMEVCQRAHLTPIVVRSRVRADEADLVAIPEAS